MTGALYTIGDEMDLVQFGEVGWWSGEGPRQLEFHPIQASTAGGGWAPHVEADGWQIGVQWQEPRDPVRVEVEVPADAAAIKVQYWQNTWPQPAAERLPGARHSWLGVDDYFNGRWVTVSAAATHERGKMVFAFDPLDIVELRGMPEERIIYSPWYGTRLRRTVRLRLVGRGPAPATVRFHAYSGSRWGELEADVWFGCGRGERGDWSGSVEAHGGAVTVKEGLRFAAADGIDGDSWRCGLAGSEKGVRLRIGCAVDASGTPVRGDGTPTVAGSSDATIVTVRTASASFSFLAADVQAGRPVFVPDLGVMVTAAGEAPDWQAIAQKAANEPGIYGRVANEPEQTLARAFAEVPALDVSKQDPFGRYMVLGMEGSRQEFALRYNGNIVLDKHALKVVGRDAARLEWPSRQLRFNIGTGDPPDFRERAGACEQTVLDGYMPIVTTRWVDRDIEFTQEAFAAPLGPLPTSATDYRGTEDMACLVRVSMRNASDGAKRARLWLNIWPSEELVLDGADVRAVGRVVPDRPVKRGWQVQRYASSHLRLQIAAEGRGRWQTIPCREPSFTPPAGHSLSDLRDLGEPDMPVAGVANSLLYQVDLEDGGCDAVVLRIPFATLTEAAELQALASLDFDERREAVAAYWSGLSAGKMSLSAPDAIVGDFLRAVPTHIAIAIDRDPGSGHYMVPAGAWVYGVCANEACLQIRLLDMLGQHERAEAYLETFLATQGRQELDGNFTSKEGAFAGVDLCDGELVGNHFAYNLDHGFVMRCLVDHYRLSGDADWLRRVAPNLVAACDFVTRERQATKVLDKDGARVAHYGLMPAGHLEDNPEWAYWFAVNGQAHGGMLACAEALAEIGHPEAGRLAADAAAYREDILAAMTRARIEAPVVRLGDGTYVPQVPVRTGIRGREYGWFRQTAYGPLHLLDGRVLQPGDPEVTWILQDMEDNLFLSWSHGWATDVQRHWFSRGGVTVQGNLLNNAVAYLRRGQRRHAVRSLLNNLALNLYRDVRVFTEHPVVEPGHGVGPFYKTPDESGWLVSLRRFLVHEEGEVLHLCWGVPQSWLAPEQGVELKDAATAFGPLSYRLSSDLGGDRLGFEAAFRWRKLPAAILLHLDGREGRRLARVWVDDQNWKDFDADAGTVTLPADGRSSVRVVAFYE